MTRAKLFHDGGPYHIETSILKELLCKIFDESTQNNKGTKQTMITN